MMNVIERSGEYPNQRYLDVSFFTFTTEQLKPREFKIAVVFLHKEMRFEA